MAKQALVNIPDRADQTRYLVEPIKLVDSDGNPVTVAAAASDATTTQALANSLRTALIALGIVQAA